MLAAKKEDDDEKQTTEEMLKILSFYQKPKTKKNGSNGRSTFEMLDEAFVLDTWIFMCARVKSK